MGLLFLLIYNVSFAQSAPYLVPRVIYVGDPAALVLPLQATEQNYPDIIITENLPLNDNIDFHRIVYERRVTGSRLVIEFTAFSPGIHEFPAIEITGESFTGLSITVNSILDGRTDRSFSGTASTLAMPGTALMLYGTIAIIVFIILLSIWFFAKGRLILKKLLEKWNRKRLFTIIRNTEKRLRKSIIKGTNNRIILDKLSDETRNFLTVLSGNNCRSMTASEFELLSDSQEELKGFGDFFRSCDGFRFSGVNINSRDIIKLLDDLKVFINELNIRGKE
ncbi:MAG: hypothetical protein FWD24_01650 [Treponema sp.]|nr:hypothetical protein [Treponema sp.]